MNLQTTEEAIVYLSEKDSQLKKIIEEVGPLSRPMREELFPALMRQIVGQQISIKAMQTVWGRLVEKLGEITPETILQTSEAEIQQCGLSFRKVAYMRAAAESVQNGEVDLNSLTFKSDEEVIAELTQLKGIGIWTAEMLLIFSLGRPDVLSWDDLAIRRGMRMVYGHEKLTKNQFNQYKESYSPYGSTASLYLWEAAMGAVPELVDPADQTNKK